MCRNGRKFDSKELSRRLGDRGDLVACLTSEIGTAVERGQDVAKTDVEELEDAVEEIDELLEAVDNQGRINAGSNESGRAGAD
jgi:hypothetical protein